jgi:hypothetical protein
MDRRAVEDVAADLVIEGPEGAAAYRHDARSRGMLDIVMG